MEIEWRANDTIPRYKIGPNRHGDTVYMEPYLGPSDEPEVFIITSSDSLFLTDEQMEELIMAYYDIKSGGKIADTFK